MNLAPRSSTQATGETPRTDAVMRGWAADDNRADLLENLARQLERELAIWQRDNAALHRACEGYRKIIDAAPPSAIESPSIPIDNSMILNAKEAEKVGMDRITISVPIRDILYAPVNGRVSAVPETRRMEWAVIDGSNLSLSPIHEWSDDGRLMITLRRCVDGANEEWFRITLPSLPAHVAEERRT